MLEELDYRAMRIIPISVLALLLIIPLLEASMLVNMLVSSGDGLGNVADNGALSTVYYVGEFLNVTALIVSLVCLYRINGISRSYNYAWIIFVFDMITELIRHAAGFFGRPYVGALAPITVLSIFYVVPMLITAGGAAVLINGLKELSGIIHGKWEKEEKGVISGIHGTDALPRSVVGLNKLKKVWVITEIVRILVWFALCVLIYTNIPAGITGTWTLTDTVRVIALMSILLFFVHVVISIIICVKMWKGFGSYYLYKYNRRA